MSIADSFIKDYRKYFDDGTYPVWELGSDVKLGDWGRMKEGRFVAEGRIDYFIAEADHPARKLIITQETGQDGFKQGVERTLEASAGTPLAPGLKADAEIVFGEAGGTILQLDNITFEKFESTIRLIEELKRFKIRRGTVFVTGIKRAGFGILMKSISSDWSIGISGDASLITAGRLGKAGVSLSEKSGGGYLRPLREGRDAYAVAMQLHRKGFFGGFGLQGADESIEPYDPYIDPE